MFDDFGINAGFVEDLHAQYRQSPQLVDEQWRTYFASLERGESPAPPLGEARSQHTNGGTNGNGSGALAHAFKAPPVAPLPHVSVNGAAPPLAFGVREEERHATAALSGRVYQLVNAYRVRGHLFAKIDPLGTAPEAAPELDLSNFGLTEADYDEEFPTVGIGGLPGRATLRQIISHLSETYCSSIGVEFTHIEEPEAREWLQNEMESTRNRAQLDNAEVVRILKHLTDAEIFEQFVHKNFVGAKRFSAEGAESMIAMLDLLIDYAAAHGVEEIVIGMPTAAA